MSYNRKRPSKSKLHTHCETCYSRRCRATVEIGVSCVMISCRAMCGATFHVCKEEEHALLCPNELLPCLNAEFGCPFRMCRYRQAQHLKTCPASVVCCSMEWNRWPLEEIQSGFYANVLKDVKEDSDLDLAMAIRDQRSLCERVKMKYVFPELIEPADEPPPPKAEQAVGGRPGEAGVNGGSDYPYGNNPSRASKTDIPLDVGTASASQNGVALDKYNLYEKMFNMEKGGCAEAQKNEGAEGDGSGKADKTDVAKGSEEKMASAESADVNASGVGYAPWEKGVLEKLGQKMSAQEYNMYIVHHGRMLISFGQMPACTPREKDFVYGNLEPIPVQTLRSYKPPTAYTAKRIHTKDYSKVPDMATKSTDTSDLGVSEKDIQTDKMYITLLCCAEKELRGHKICERVSIDGYFIDIATQTYSFPSAPFKRDTSLADITAEEKLKMYVQIQSESISSRFVTPNCPFTFRCGHAFRRDEYGYHYKNLHADIQFSLEGWFEQRCPLAYLGCTYTRRNIHPLGQRANTSYHQDLSTFSLRPEVGVSVKKAKQTAEKKTKRSKKSQTKIVEEDSLGDLPYEVLCHIAGYLDSFSLSQLALVSQLFRDVCSTHLQERGMVCLKWKKKSYSHGGSRWKCSPVWEYSLLFSKVDKWCLGDKPSMAEHLKVCPFYKPNIKTKKTAVIFKDKKSTK